MTDDWPALPYEPWRDTRDTLHMYTQVIGKLRLALSPFEPEWANVPLYLSARGLTSSPIPVGLRTIDAEFDLIDHVLVLRSSDGLVEQRPLGGAVADFYTDVMAALARMGVAVSISAVPAEVDDPIPFADDRTHHVYNTADANAFFRVLSMVDVVFKEHRAGFRGRTTPVQFFWGSFDLALTRFSGGHAPASPAAGVIARFSGGVEEICAGWWPGDERVPYPAFYAYASPPPEGIEQAAITPPGAAWIPPAGEFILPYDVARAAGVPRDAILAFLASTFAAASTRMGWDPGLTDFPVPGHRGLEPRPG